MDDNKYSRQIKVYIDNNLKQTFTWNKTPADDEQFCFECCGVNKAREKIYTFEYIKTYRETQIDRCILHLNIVDHIDFFIDEEPLYYSYTVIDKCRMIIRFCNYNIMAIMWRARPYYKNNRDIIKGKTTMMTNIPDSLLPICYNYKLFCKLLFLYCLMRGDVDLYKTLCTYDNVPKPSVGEIFENSILFQYPDFNFLESLLSYRDRLDPDPEIYRILVANFKNKNMFMVKWLYKNFDFDINVIFVEWLEKKGCYIYDIYQYHAEKVCEKLRNDSTSLFSFLPKDVTVVISKIYLYTLNLPFD
jgi:hypothetical protein